MYGDRGIQWQKCPFSRTKERVGEGGGPFPESYSSDSASRPEPGRILGAREKDRETNRQTDGKSPEKKKIFFFILESEASAGEWGRLLCENALLATLGRMWEAWRVERRKDRR